jgi:hypothetical protein
MRIKFFLILMTIWPSVSLAIANRSHWFLNHGKIGGENTHIELEDKRYDFTNANGQECWVTSINRQRDAEERTLVCKIDSKNQVATSLACWYPFSLKQRSLATSKLMDSTKV